MARRTRIANPSGPILDTGNSEVTGNPTGNSEPTANGNGDDPGNGGAREYVIDPAAVSGTADNGDGGTGEPVKRRRGRKPGSRNSKASVPVNIDAVSALLYSTHTLLSVVTGNDVFKLEQQEADELSKAYAGVARHYPTLQQSEKMIDWGHLISALGMIYGTRVFALRQQWRAQKAAQPRASTANMANGADMGSTRVTIPGIGQVEVPRT